jgi:hypothetical protein
MTIANATATQRRNPVKLVMAPHLSESQNSVEDMRLSGWREGAAPFNPRQVRQSQSAKGNKGNWLYSIRPFNPRGFHDGTVARAI